MQYKIVCMCSLLLLNLAGCSFLGKSPPQWIGQLPAEDHSYYALGQGVDIFNAEENARISLASQFGAIVNDQTSIHTFKDNEFSQTLIEIFTSVDVVDVKLAQAKTLKQAKYKGLHYVLIALPKSSLKTQLKQDIKKQISLLQSISTRQNKTGFAHWWELRQLLSTAKSLERNALLFSTVNSTPHNQAIKTLQRFYRSFTEQTLARTLSIENKTNINGLTDVAKKQLYEEKIAISKSYIFSLFQSDRIMISDHYKKERIGQDFFVTGSLDVKLILSTGHTVSRFKITDQSISLNGFSESTALVKKQLIEQFSKVNILSCFVKKLPSCSKGI